MEAELLTSRFEMDELLSKIHPDMRHNSDPHKAKAGRRLAVRLLVGGRDGASGTEQSSDGREVSERRGRRMHKSASEANVKGAGSRGGHALAGSMGALTGSGKALNGSAMKAQLRAEQEELAYLGMEAERIESSGVIDIVNDDGAAFPKHLSWNYRGLDITPKCSSGAEAGADRDREAGVESVLASWAQERRELEAQVGALKAELKRKERELKAAGKAKAAAGREVDAVWGQVSALEAQLHELQGDKSALEKEIEGLRALHVSSARDSGESAGARAADTEMAGMLKMVGDFSRRLALADDAVRRAEAKNGELSVRAFSILPVLPPFPLAPSHSCLSPFCASLLVPCPACDLRHCAERVKASEAQLRGTREALRTAQEERDALAAEMKEALDSWACTGSAHPTPPSATPGTGGGSGSGGMGVGASRPSAPLVEHMGEAMAGNGFPGAAQAMHAMQHWQQRAWDIAGASKSGRRGYSAGGGVRRPPRDPKTWAVQFDALSCSPSPP
ncbi:unnamed protein product [Closterium sp. Naga37s-1]|nr:unnamed protein product [Closterium sp. Naga37s-1]